MRSLLLVSYGAPEKQEDVVPFLNNFFAGKNVPAARIEAATHKYEKYAITTGHYSPLNAECRKMIAKIQRIDPNLHIYWGNLFWHPLLTAAVAEMTRNGVQDALCFATSAFDSPSGNQQYADALEAARATVGMDAPILRKLPLPFEHPLFIEAQVDQLSKTAADNQLPATVIMFSAHSILCVDAARCHYVEQLLSTCRAVIEKSGITIPWELVYQSRSGASEHWLGPDIKERIRELFAAGRVESVIVSPIGFFCENMETEYDLDVEVGACCAELGLSFSRVKTVGTTAKICQMITDMIETGQEAPEH